MASSDRRMSCRQWFVSSVLSVVDFIWFADDLPSATNGVQGNMASYQYVYVMKDLTKAFPGGREVFKGITLAFLPGVKIGVLGVNGAGKSTLLKIMAGIETEYGGEAWAAEGVRVGYLSQEPALDAGDTVGENVRA